jgi:bis(5'-adenosyl)-triphosphatase
MITTTECPFDDPQTQEFAGDGRYAALYNISPVLPGHSLIIPRRHVASLNSLDDDELTGFFRFARRVTSFLVARFDSDGFDWMLQDGEAAGQTVPHVHLHVLPRWKGDLPRPGDWYRQLDASGGVDTRDLDSSERPRLAPEDLARTVAALRDAAQQDLRA